MGAGGMLVVQVVGVLVVSLAVLFAVIVVVVDHLV